MPSTHIHWPALTIVVVVGYLIIGVGITLSTLLFIMTAGAEVDEHLNDACDETGVSRAVFFVLLFALTLFAWPLVVLVGDVEA